VLTVRFEGHTPEALQRIQGEMMAFLRTVKPDAEIAKGH
jgi:phosphomannomutase